MTEKLLLFFLLRDLLLVFSKTLLQVLFLHFKTIQRICCKSHVQQCVRKHCIEMSRDQIWHKEALHSNMLGHSFNTKF